MQVYFTGIWRVPARAEKDSRGTEEGTTRKERS